MTTFTVDLEEGDLTDFDATATDSGDLSAHADAALYGSYGLKLVLDDTNEIYGRVTFANKTRVRAGFYLDPNGLTMASGDEFIIAGAGANPGNAGWSVRLQHDGSNYRVRAAIRDDTPAWLYTDYVTITDEPHWIEVDVMIATGVGANDGFIKLWVDTVDASPDASQTGVDNDAIGDYDDVGLCARNIDAGTSGTFYMDHLIANDDGTEIGNPSAGTPIGAIADHHYRTRSA